MTALKAEKYTITKMHPHITITFIDSYLTLEITLNHVMRKFPQKDTGHTDNLRMANVT